MNVINPYPFIGTKHTEALDFIIANLPPDPTFDNLNEILVSAVYTPDPINPVVTELTTTFTKTILPFAHNAYVKGGNESEQVMNAMGTYSDKQAEIISYLLQALHSTPTQALGEVLLIADEKIAASKLPLAEQMPLYAATASAKSDYEYWLARINDPGVWAPYLDGGSALIYLHIPALLIALVKASLLCYAMPHPLQVQQALTYSSMTAAIGLVAGKVVFAWTPVG